jgi:hypothetical protein
VVDNSDYVSPSTVVATGWVAADEVYGNAPAFRARLRSLGVGLVLAVSCGHRVLRPDVPIDSGKVRAPRHGRGQESTQKVGVLRYAGPLRNVLAGRQGVGVIRAEHPHSVREQLLQSRGLPSLAHPSGDVVPGDQSAGGPGSRGDRRWRQDLD